MLAATLEGDAVVTSDELGGVRLWPVLDGSTEPRVVELPRPARLAIAREPGAPGAGAGFAIAALDAAGGLVIQRVDGDGLARARAVLAPDPAFTGVAAIPGGLLAWRADHRLMRLLGDGSIAHQLAPEPGQRVVAVATAGARAVAVIDAVDGPRRARWIELAGRLRWGAWIRAAGPLGEHVALGPEGARLATLVLDRPDGGGARVHVYDAVTGAAVVEHGAFGVAAIGFASDRALALSTASGGLAWLDLAGAAPPGARRAPGALPSPPLAPILGTGGGRAIAGALGQLAIATPARQQFLGYGLPSPSFSVPGPDGSILVTGAALRASGGPSGGPSVGPSGGPSGGDPLALIDRALVAGPAPALAIPEGAALADARWLGGATWLVASSRRDDGMTSIALVDAAGARTRTLLSGDSLVPSFEYEPATRMLGLSIAERAILYRIDLAALRAHRVATLSRARPGERVWFAPVDPARAGGVRLVVGHEHEDGAVVLRWARDPAAPARGPVIRAADVRGGPAIDAAGRAYQWTEPAERAYDLGVYRHGERIGALPFLGMGAVYPDPSGERIALLGAGMVSLVTAGGERRWARPFEGVSQVLWLSDGALAIVGAGIARLDPATGAVRAARCGWQFGLSSSPHPHTPPIEQLCTQLE